MCLKLWEHSDNDRWNNYKIMISALMIVLMKLQMTQGALKPHHIIIGYNLVSTNERNIMLSFYSILWTLSSEFYNNWKIKIFWSMQLLAMQLEWRHPCAQGTRNSMSMLCHYQIKVLNK